MRGKIGAVGLHILSIQLWEAPGTGVLAGVLPDTMRFPDTLCRMLPRQWVAASATGPVPAVAEAAETGFPAEPKLYMTRLSVPAVFEIARR